MNQPTYYKFLGLVLVMAGLLSGCGTVTQGVTGGNQVQVSQTPNPANITYIDYPTPSHDTLKSIFQNTVVPGSTVKVYNNVGLTSLVGQQVADSLGMFVIDLGDDVMANNTVYLVVVENGKQPSNALAFNR